MAGFDDLGEGVRKFFLAGVGAAAMGAEKSQEIVESLVKKGELTVEQGKTVNEELKHKFKDAASSASDAALKARMSAMSPEERAQWIAKAQKIASDLEAETIHVEVADAAEAEATDEAPEA